MAESSIKDSDKVLFDPGKQREFLLRAIRKSGCTQKRFATLLGVSTRTLSDWLREKHPLSYGTAHAISERIGTRMPHILQTKDKYWYAAIGAKKGGMAAYAKSRFGNNEAYRKAQWQKWWTETGKQQSAITQPRAVSLPVRSEKLAEFIGIMLGDGGLTDYQCKISLNREADHQYSLFVERLASELFDVPVKRLARPLGKSLDLVISRKGVTDFLVEAGVKKGNKLLQGLDVPPWIMQNKQYRRACMRGLMDTDGCLVRETHMRKSKRYTYARLNFTSLSPSLIESVMSILRNDGLDPILRRGGKSVQVEKKDKIWHYFTVIGTSNPKHLERWRSIQ